MVNIPITTSIRKVIFENFNGADLRFNNDQIFEILKQHEIILMWELLNISLIEKIKSSRLYENHART